MKYLRLSPLGVFILVTGILLNILIGYKIQIPIIKTIILFPFVFFLPGVLLLAITTRKHFVLSIENVYLSIIFSISVLMLGGLLLNSLLPYLNIGHPLDRGPVLIFMDIYILIIFFILRKNNFTYTLATVTYKHSKYTLIVLSIFILFFSIVGSISLNNSGSNIFIILAISLLIVVQLLLLKGDDDKISNKVLNPIIIWLLGYAVLLMYANRSQFNVGWDINLENYVFSITNVNKLWFYGSFKNSYNSCISITILPTIINSLFSFSNVSIYKYIYTAIFALVPVGIYLLALQFTYPKIGLLASYFFIAQTYFLEQMPALARQEIAFLFLISFYIVLTQEIYTKKTRFFINTILGLSIITAHYSTSYIWVVTIIFTYLTALALQLLFKIKAKSRVTLPYICLMLVFLFVWQFKFSSSENQLGNLVTKTYTRIKEGITTGMIMEGLNKLSFSSNTINTLSNSLENYNYYTFLYSQRNLELYKEIQYKYYNPLPIKSIKLPDITNNLTSSLVSKVLLINKIFLIILCPIVGLVITILKLRMQKTNDGYFTIICVAISSIPLIGMILFLPYIKAYYNLSRLYLQAILTLSLFTIVGSVTILKILFRRASGFIMTGLLVSIFYLYSNGIFFMIIGGEPFMHLYNFGEEYNYFYTSSDEAKAAKWLKQNKNENSSIYTDEVAGLRLTAQAGIIDYIYDMYPSTITKSSYVYYNRVNRIFNKTYQRYNDSMLAFKAPTNFLEKTKNAIYCNKGSVVYK